MKISEFVKNFIDKKVMNTAINQNAVSDYLKKELEVKDYVPFAEKRDLCARVLEACNTKDDSGLVKVDSISRYILFTIAIISKYTNDLHILSHTIWNCKYHVVFVVITHEI